jgi:hypothetical protein
MDWLGSRYVTCFFCGTCPCCVLISEQNSEAKAVSLRNKEEYKDSTCEDLTCEMKTLCVLWDTDVWSVTNIVLVLKSVDRKRLGKLCRRIAIV